MVLWVKVNVHTWTYFIRMTNTFIVLRGWLFMTIRHSWCILLLKGPKCNHITATILLPNSSHKKVSKLRLLKKPVFVYFFHTYTNHKYTLNLTKKKIYICYYFIYTYTNEHLHFKQRPKILLKRMKHTSRHPYSTPNNSNTFIIKNAGNFGHWFVDFFSFLLRTEWIHSPGFWYFRL